MILRHLNEQLIKRLAGPKSIILSGSHKAGKSTLLRELEPHFKKPVLWWQGDEAETRGLLQSLTPLRVRQLIGSANTLIIDEAQQIEEVSQCIKVITDTIKQVKVIACSSASFDLANRIDDQLNGRKWEFHLYPLSFSELVNHHGLIEETKQLNHRLVFGYYPEIVNNPGEEISRLRQMTDRLLYKNILTWERILKPEKIERLVQAIAWQMGQAVSYHELGQMCDLDNQTVEKYVLLLEKAFIIHRLPSYYRNLPGELKKSRKLYFYDNGIRNAVINQFNPIDNRNDTEALWENFLINERLKHITYQTEGCDRYFWRTHAQQEIDCVEERNGVISAYAFKWNRETKARFPKAFKDAYKPVEATVVTKDNFFPFIGLE